MYGMMDILAEYGNELRMPYSEHLDDGIFEVRAKFGSNITRVLYFFYVGKISGQSSRPQGTADYAGWIKGILAD